MTPALRRSGHSFSAAFPGHCAACPEPIRPRDEITCVILPDGSDGYCHDRCVGWVWSR